MMHNFSTADILNWVKERYPVIKYYLSKNYPDDIDIDGLDCYKNYISQFDPNRFNYVDCSFTYAQKDLLFNLIIASFNAYYDLEPNSDELNMRLCISVDPDDELFKTYLDELTFYQIKNIFTIYMSEQIHYEKYALEDEKRKEKIFADREKKIKEWRFKNALAQSKINYLKLLYN